MKFMPFQETDGLASRSVFAFSIANRLCYDLMDYANALGVFSYR